MRVTTSDRWLCFLHVSWDWVVHICDPIQAQTALFLVLSPACVLLWNPCDTAKMDIWKRKLAKRGKCTIKKWSDSAGSEVSIKDQGGTVLAGTTHEGVLRKWHQHKLQATGISELFPHIERKDTALEADANIEGSTTAHPGTEKGSICRGNRTKRRWQYC